MIRILLVDDQNLVRQGLQALLSSNQQLEIVGYAANGKDALEQVAKHRPDIVLIDIEMPQMNGIVATQKISEQFSTTKVIVLSSHENIKYLTKSLQAGAKGYLLKETLFEDLEKAIELVHRGYSQIESKLLADAIAETKIANSEKEVSSQVNKRTLYFSKAIANSAISDRELSLNSTPTSNSNGFYPTQQQTSEPIEPLESKLKTDSNGEASHKNSSTEPLSSKISSQSSAHNSSSNSKNPVSNKTLIWTVGILVLAIAGSILIVTRLRLFNRPTAPASTEAAAITATPEIETVAALGRIRPQGEVISLSAPTSLEAIQVEKLLVKEGDRVKAGQMIAILDGRERQQAALAEARTGVEIAQARLDRVQAGAKQGAIAAKQAAIANLQAELTGEQQSQQAAIAKLTAQLNNARTQLQRHQQLYDRGAISASELDSKILAANTAQEQLNEAEANFERTQRTLEARIQEAIASLQETQEVRPVEVQIARAELARAKAAVNRAESDMELAYVRTPLAGEILAVHTRPGEALNQKGIVEIAQTDRMTVLAEVDQNDINRVELGQKATVSSGVFTENLEGKVHQISSLIGKNDILDTDPTADEDTRVVEVEILLAPEDSQKVAKLTNLEVDVTIDTSAQNQ